MGRPYSPLCVQNLYIFRYSGESPHSDCISDMNIDSQKRLQIKDPENQ